MSNKESQLAVFLTSSEGMSCGRLYITLAALQCIDSRELNSFLFVPHRQIGSAYVTEDKMTLNRVVYLLWPSTFKGNVTRDSKNVCHGMFMVNSKSIMLSTCYSTHNFSSFDNSLRFYNGGWPQNIIQDSMVADGWCRFLCMLETL